MSKIPLTQALMDSLIFSLEDQTGRYGLEVKTAQVIPLPASAPSSDAEVLPLPLWDSHEGFRMMRLFSDSLRNPLVRQEIEGILDRGGGVFKAFKNFLKAHEQWNAAWNAFKRRHMTSRILKWAEDLPALCHWSLEQLLPLETAEALLLQDFALAQDPGGSQWMFWQDLYQRERMDRWVSPKGPGLEWLFPPLIREEVERGAGGKLEGLVFTTASDEPAGACYWLGPVLLVWYVFPQFRGMGLGKVLLERALARLDGGNHTFQMIFPYPLEPDLTEAFLRRKGFAPVNGFFVKV